MCVDWYIQYVLEGAMCVDWYIYTICIRGCNVC